jgi:hypothetical protein
MPREGRLDAVLKPLLHLGGWDYAPPPRPAAPPPPPPVRAEALGDFYAGDAQMPDLQRREERLLSYAVDRRTEVATESAEPRARLTSIRVARGVKKLDSQRQEYADYLANLTVE